MAHYFLAFTSRSPLPPARVGLVYRLNLAGLEDNTLRFPLRKILTRFFNKIRGNKR